MKITVGLLVACFVTLLVESSSGTPTPGAKLLSSEFIASINAKKSTWRAGRNFPPNTPMETLKRLAGSIFTDDNLGKPKNYKVHDLSKIDIPEQFDAREHWPKCPSIGEVRNQGSCGSCWAFGAATAMSDRVCIHSEGRKNFQFSPEDLIECCADCGDCEGGYKTLAWQHWVSTGVVSGGDVNSNLGCKPYSYSAYISGTNPDKCVKNCQNNIPYEQDKQYGIESYAIHGSDVAQIQAEIMTNGPVETHFRVYEDFYAYKDGVYQYVAGNFAGGHAVRIIGWGVENATPYWLVANSWGPDWGELDGFFKILRGENHLNIEADIDGGIPKI